MKAPRIKYTPHNETIFLGSLMSLALPWCLFEAIIATVFLLQINYTEDWSFHTKLISSLYGHTEFIADLLHLSVNDIIVQLTNCERATSRDSYNIIATTLHQIFTLYY